jgi:hypothetical protein
MTIQQNKLHLREVEKEKKEIMVEKLNYGNLGVLAIISNTKMLKKKNLNMEGEDFNV